MDMTSRVATLRGQGFPGAGRAAGRNPPAPSGPRGKPIQESGNWCFLVLWRDPVGPDDQRFQRIIPKEEGVEVREKLGAAGN